MTIPAHLDVNLYLQQSATGYAHDGNELLADFISKINEIIDALISGGTIGDITEIVAGVNLDGGGDTGVVTIDMSPTVDLAGAAGTATLIARKAATAQTAVAISAVAAFDTGTYGTGSTGTDFYSYALWADFNGSKSSGSDRLQGWGVYGNVRGTPDVGIGVLGWAHSQMVTAINYGGFFQASENVGATSVGLVGYAGSGALTQFAPDAGDLGGVFSGIFRGGTLKCESDFKHTGTNFGAFSATPTTKRTVTGSRQGNAALASALTGLAQLGFITDSSSAGTNPATPIVEHLEAAPSTVAINPVDDVAFLGNTGGGETIVEYTLAAGAVDGHVIRLAMTTTTSTRGVHVTPSSLGAEGASTFLSVGNGPASATLVWNDTTAKWYVIDLRNFTLA